MCVTQLPGNIPELLFVHCRLVPVVAEIITCMLAQSRFANTGRLKTVISTGPDAKPARSRRRRCSTISFPDAGATAGIATGSPMLY